MDKFQRYSYTLRNILLLMIGISIITRFNATPSALALFIPWLIFIVTNDYLRLNGYFLKQKQGVKKHIASLVFSMIAGNLLAYFTWGYADIYMLILIYEIIFSFSNTPLKVLLTGQIASVLTVIFIRVIRTDSIRGEGLSILSNLIFIASFILFLITFKGLIVEKAKVTKLNKEIEQLTIEKERHRVAQEIHDSLGHSLTAIIMHLDYIEKVIGNNPEKARDVVIKTQGIARNSMEQVREAVYALKDEQPSSKDLIGSIKDLAQILNVNEGVSVSYSVDEDVNKLPSNIKYILFKSIQESLTNGIRHGKATKFHIYIGFNGSEKLIAEVSDNGVGCVNIEKGTGIMGIENRVKSILGEVDFHSKLGEGFTVKISIPLEEVAHGKNKINVS